MDGAPAPALPLLTQPAEAVHGLRVCLEHGGPVDERVDALVVRGLRQAEDAHHRGGFAAA